MADLKQVLAEAATQIEAAIPGIQRRGTSDLRPDLLRMTPGQTQYQLTGALVAKVEVGSNVIREVCELGVVVRHRLADPTAERTYTEGAMVDQMEALVDTRFWRAFVTLYDVLQDAQPQLQEEVERTGNVITFQYALQAYIQE